MAHENIGGNTFPKHVRDNIINICYKPILDYGNPKKDDYQICL